MHRGQIRRTIRILALAMLATAWAEARAGAQMRITWGTTTFKSAVNEVVTDYFRPLDDQKHPAIIYLHGGGFSVNDPVMKRFAAALAGRGYVVIMPHFLAIHHSNWETWRVTAHDAVTYAQGLPSVDPSRIGMSGLSMGGQTGLSVAARDKRVGAVAEFFTAWPGTLPDEPIDSLPPVLLINGTADPIIPLDKALALDAILEAHHLPYERYLYRGQGHGFGTGAVFEDGVRHTADFFDTYLGGPGLAPTAPATLAGGSAGSGASGAETGHPSGSGGMGSGLATPIGSMLGGSTSGLAPGVVPDAMTPGGFALDGSFLVPSLPPVRPQPRRRRRTVAAAPPRAKPDAAVASIVGFATSAATPQPVTGPVAEPPMPALSDRSRNR